MIYTLRVGEVDVLVALTGEGMRALRNLISECLTVEVLAELLFGVRLTARGPKASRAMREMGLNLEIVASSPHTWGPPKRFLRRRAVFRKASLGAALRGQPQPPDERAGGGWYAGARVHEVPVYRRARTEDLSTVHKLLDVLIAGRVRIALFTSAPQAVHLMQIVDVRGRLAGCPRRCGDRQRGA